MAEIIDKGADEDVLVEEDLTKLDDSTDWKAKAEELEQKRREDGIRSRERNKALKEKLASLETFKPTEKKDKPEEFGLLQKSFLRAAGITDPEEIELARTTAKKWGVEIDAIVDDEDFKVKLERLRTSKSNALASSNIRGSAGTQSAKNTPEYWISKGAPPTKADVPDRKTRAGIIRKMMERASTGGKTFYND